MDITDHEINKFILIFYTLLKTSLNKDKFDIKDISSGHRRRCSRYNYINCDKIN